MDNTNALALPDEAQFTTSIQAINRFQQIVHANMVKGLDYGVIPGTGNKPTLLKPGAEKIVKLLGLSDDYELVDRQENWETGFFRYLIKCRLATVSTNTFIAAGLGECNSKESKYRWRWLFASQLPADIQGEENKEERHKLVFRTITVNKGKPNAYDTKQYRYDNDDIFSQVNTILKMAKKRSLVDAALSAGRLSDVFTQDVEDMAPSTVEDEPDWDAIKNEAAVVEKKEEPVVYEPIKAGELPHLKNPGELLTRCNKNKILRAEAFKILNITAITQLADLDAAWVAIAKEKDIK